MENILRETAKNNLRQNQKIPHEELVIQHEYALKVRQLLLEQCGKINSRNTSHTKKNMSALVKTFGCQGNLADSEKILGMLVEMGYTVAPNEEVADLILYNTCAIRENAQARLFGMVGKLKKYKQQNPNLIIGLCGCMIQQGNVVEKVRKSYHQVDLMFGTHVMHTLPQLLYKVLQARYNVQEQKCHDKKSERQVVDCREQLTPRIAEGLPIQRTPGAQASVQIMAGCNNFCSYCIVPYVRGREVSRDPEKILQEAKTVIKQGYKEILLLGQNVNSYAGGGKNFLQLLESLDALQGDFWIRFMTSHPKDCSEELIDTIAKSEKICHSIHLPVQSGSNRILEDMNRKYTKERYLELIDYAKKKIPDITFTSDIIVGFPGETKEDFLQTADLCQKVRYQSLFTFLYSPRPGTIAVKMPDPVSQEEKTIWLNQLIELQHRIMEEDNPKYVGETLKVLVEQPKNQQANPQSLEYIPEFPNKLIGRSNQGMLVSFEGPQELVGTFANVTVIQAHRSQLAGVISDS